ncbi:MAG: hypothetical protein ABIP30_15615 [Ferruginibacter sp.]
MKLNFLLLLVFLCTISVHAQNDMKKYPEPEFASEVFYLKKDTVNLAIRLEKQSSKLDSKTKLGGFGGYESGYSIENSQSTVRIGHGHNLSFVYSTGVISEKKISSSSDSMMRANGIDPDAMGGMMQGFNNPFDNIILYKCETGNGKRKILMQKGGGMVSISKKIKSSEKFSFSVKKIREGYSELIIDKTLPAGEYAFCVPQRGSAGMSGDVVAYTFGIGL